VDVQPDWADDVGASSGHHAACRDDWITFPKDDATKDVILITLFLSGCSGYGFIFLGVLQYP
jgi:hypothetical protein